jgi:hypothetical protein
MKTFEVASLVKKDKWVVEGGWDWDVKRREEGWIKSLSFVEDGDVVEDAAAGVSGGVGAGVVVIVAVSFSS